MVRYRWKSSNSCLKEYTKECLFYKQCLLGFTAHTHLGKKKKRSYHKIYLLSLKFFLKVNCVELLKRYSIHLRNKARKICKLLCFTERKSHTKQSKEIKKQKIKKKKKRKERDWLKRHYKEQKVVAWKKNQTRGNFSNESYPWIFSLRGCCHGSSSVRHLSEQLGAALILKSKSEQKRGRENHSNILHVKSKVKTLFIFGAPDRTSQKFLVQSTNQKSSPGIFHLKLSYSNCHSSFLLWVRTTGIHPHVECS